MGAFEDWGLPEPTYDYEKMAEAIMDLGERIQKLEKENDERTQKPTPPPSPLQEATKGMEPHEQAHGDE